MGLFSFIKEAGEKLFGGSAAQAAEPAQDLNAKAAKAIETYIGTQNLGVSDVKVQFDGSQGKVTVQGTAPTQAVKEKVTLCCGNVSSVQSVDNQMAVTSPEPEALPRRGARRHAVGHRQEVLWRCQQVPRDLRGQQAHAEPPRQDLPRPETAHPGAVTGFAFAKTAFGRFFVGLSTCR
jgi:hypothetical protein